MTPTGEVNVPETGTKAPEVITTEIPGNWIAQKDKLKKKFQMVTDADLVFGKGKKEEMLTNLSNKLHKSKEELKAIIAAL